MASTLEEPVVHPSINSSQRLRAATTAVRIAFTWLGVRKSLSSEQKTQAADTFGAESGYLSAGKKLLDTSHPAFKTVSSVRNRIVSYWKGMTLPYPESGIRLIRNDRVDSFNEQLNELREELTESVWRLDEHYAELKSAAYDRLGSLYEESDYPRSLQGLFEVSWDFPSVEPPAYLQQLHPEIYQQERDRVSARFDEAVQLAENAFVEELHKLVSHLTERLSGQTDGKPKVFRDSAVENLEQFFQRFRQLNIRSNDQLDDLVNHCQQIVGGVEPQKLRQDNDVRQVVAQELTSVQGVLDDLLVDRPRRRILRRPR